MNPKPRERWHGRAPSCRSPSTARPVSSERARYARREMLRPVTSVTSVTLHAATPACIDVLSDSPSHRKNAPPVLICPYSYSLALKCAFAICPYSYSLALKCAFASTPRPFRRTATAPQVPLVESRFTVTSVTSVTSVTLQVPLVESEATQRTEESESEEESSELPSLPSHVVPPRLKPV